MTDNIENNEPEDRQVDMTTSEADLPSEIEQPAHELATLGIGFEVGEMGLVVVGRPSFGDWATAYHQTGKIKQAFQWVLGDLIIYGEDTYGEMYAAVLDEYDYDYGYLRNVVWVCKTFPIDRRRFPLTFSHYTVVAPLSKDDQERWLALAVYNKWSKEELVKHIKDEDPEPKPPKGLLELDLILPDVTYHFKLKDEAVKMQALVERLTRLNLDDLRLSLTLEDQD